MNRRKLLVLFGIALLAAFMPGMKCGGEDDLEPPAKPAVTLPPGSLYQNAEISVGVNASQPQEKDVRYVIDWGDGTTDTTTERTPGARSEVKHVYPNTGSYQFKALAFLAEKPELASEWSDEVTIAILANQAPTNVIITYPARGGLAPRNRDTRFEAIAEDPDGDSVEYQFDLGDGSQSSWTTPPVASGEPGEVYHKYSRLGEYYVKARARDTKGSMSVWSDSVKMLIDTTGVVVWSWFTPDENEGPAITSALVLMMSEEPVIYVGADDESGKFWGISAVTGRRKASSSSTDEDLYNGHPAYVEASQNIIAGCENGELYAFSLSLSTQWRWPDSSLQRPTYVDWGVPAVNGRRVYCTRDSDEKRGEQARLYCLIDNTSSVTYQSHRDIPDVKGNPVINGAGQVIAVTSNGQLLVFDSNLSPVWDTVLTTGDAALNAPVVGAAGHIYVGDVNGNVYRINSGFTVDWTAQVTGEANSIVIGSGAIFVATGEGRVYRLNPETGAIIWQTTLQDANNIETSPILTTNGMIYIHDDQDALHCIKQADGSGVWRIECAEYAPLGAFSRRGRDFESPELNPAITPTGDIVVVGFDALYLVAGYIDGTLMPSEWPKWQGGMHNSGKAGGF